MNELVADDDEVSTTDSATGVPAPPRAPRSPWARGAKARPEEAASSFPWVLGATTATEDMRAAVPAESAMNHTTVTLPADGALLDRSYGPAPGSSNGGGHVLDAAAALAVWLDKPRQEALESAPATPAAGEDADEKPAGKAARKGKPKKGAKRGQADRAAETLFRIVYQQHEQLSGMADAKAHIMITLCAALAGVAATQVFDPLLQYAAATLMLTCLLAAGFAVYATVPWLRTTRRASESDVPGSSWLFFGQFCEVPPDVFEQEMERLVRDRQQVLRALARDLHSLGTLLRRKQYRFLRYCYWTFLAGFGASLAILAVTALGVWP